jgi:15-cis-phytoene synthase
MNDNDAWCADLLKRRDPERWLASLYVPEARRGALVALWALDLEVGDVVAKTTEAMVGQIRLAWWRERLRGLADGAPQQPVLAALAAHGVDGPALEPLEDAALAALDGRWPESARTRGETLFMAGAKLLGGPVTDAVRQAGVFWASRRSDVPAHLEPGRAPAPLRPLFALAALARLPVQPAGSPVTPGRQARLLWSIVSGRH